MWEMRFFLADQSELRYGWPRILFDDTSWAIEVITDGRFKSTERDSIVRIVSDGNCQSGPLRAPGSRVPGSRHRCPGFV